MSVSIAGGPARDQNFEDKMEEAFQLPDYLNWMDQKEKDHFVQEMNKAGKNEDDLENMTPKDFERLGIYSAKTHRFMRRAIREHFNPDFGEELSEWRNEMNAPQTGSDEELETVALDAVLVEAGNPGKRKATEGGNGKEPEDKGRGKGYFKIRKPLGEKDINTDENLRLSMDNEMEFTKFKSDTIQVSLAEPNMESFLDFAFSSSNTYEFACMRVPPKTGFYKAINWIDRDFKEVPFRSSKYPNPMSVMGGYMGAGKDSKLYWEKRRIGYITLKNWTNQTVNLMDVGEW